MTVKDIIKVLETSYKPGDSLIIAWWDFEKLAGHDGGYEGSEAYKPLEHEDEGHGITITKDAWPEFALHVSSKMDWSSDSDAIGWMWDDWRDEEEQGNTKEVDPTEVYRRNNDKPKGR